MEGGIWDFLLSGIRVVKIDLEESQKELIRTHNQRVCEVNPSDMMEG